MQNQTETSPTMLEKDATKENRSPTFAKSLVFLVIKITLIIFGRSALKLMYLKRFWTGIVLVLVLMLTFASIFID